MGPVEFEGSAVRPAFARPDAMRRERLDRARTVMSARCARLGIGGADHLLEATRQDAERLLGSGDDLAETLFAADAIVALLCSGGLPHAEVGPMVRELEDEVGADAVRVGLRALQDPRLVLLPLEECLDATLALLESCGRVDSASVWVPGDDTGPRLLRWRREVPSGAIPDLASRAMAGADGVEKDGCQAVAIVRFDRPCAALAYRTEDADGGPAVVLGVSLARLLSRVFERAAVFAKSAEGTAALLRSSERRMTRIGFDLHDGPLQDIALLAGEVEGLRAALAAEPAAAALLPRIDDLVALADHLDDELRAVANSLNSTGMQRRPFTEAIGAIVRTFGSRADCEPELQLSGDLDNLSDSQTSALLRVVEECLNNVRTHSGASNVRIAITSTATKVDATIEDDGAGFDVELALRDAGRRGRMGLLGVIERVRLLGGFCEVRSRPGEGCSVALTVARWTPEMARLAAEAGEAGDGPAA